MTTFNPAAEQRCARCGQWWMTTHVCPDQIDRVIPPPRQSIDSESLFKITAERDAWRRENAALANVLYLNGFQRCDVPACNCGSWHHRFGLPERMAEIKDALADAGHPLSNDNGNKPLNALAGLVSERDALRAEVESLTQQLKAGESFHAVAVQQRDTAWREAESLRAEVERLRADAEALRDPVARPLAEWHEDMGPVLWWCMPVAEGPWVGQPTDSDWPGYHTHWTKCVGPSRAAQEGKT